MLIISQPFTQHNPRLTVVRIVIGLLLSVLLLALARVQVVQGHRFQTRENTQSLRRIRLPSARGEIVDRNGVVLADNRPSYDVVVYLEQLNQTSRRQDVVQLASVSLRALSQSLQMPVTLTEFAVSNHYARRRPIPLPVWRDLGGQQIAAFAERASSLPGADMVVTPVREYPQGALAAHVLGFTGKAAANNDEDIEKYYYYQPDSVGRQGVERACDEYLRGAPGGRSIRVGPSGSFVGEIGKKAPERGSKVTLTIDTRLQRLVEAAMANAPLPAGKIMRGAAIAMHVRSGEILAMTSLPTFDPNLFNSATPPAAIRAMWQDPHQPTLNRAYGGLYAPGSIFKPITLLAGLESGAIAADNQVSCEGSLKIGTWPRPFGCWNRAGHGTLDAIGAMKQSCDVWFYVAGMKTGVHAINEMARSFGLGEPTGFDIGQEYEGLVPSAAWKRQQRDTKWWDGDTAQLSIGQSYLQVTPLQMVVAAAAFANGGQVLQPYIVKRIETAAGVTLHESETIVRKQVRASRRNLEMARRTMLAAVQQPDGTAHRAVVNGLTIAGKTGTAEFDTKQGRINRVWFIGFAPYDNPQIALSILIEDADSGGHTAAPIAGEIFAGLFGKEKVAVGSGGEYGD